MPTYVRNVGSDRVFPCAVVSFRDYDDGLTKKNVDQLKKETKRGARKYDDRCSLLASIAVSTII